MRSSRGGSQIRAHLWVFPLFLVSALGEKEVRLNEFGILLGSIIFRHGDLC